MDNPEIALLISKNIQPLFKKLPSELSIKEKIAIFKIRHECNYFLDMELSDVNKLNVDEFSKPNYKVTSKLLETFLSRDQKSKIKKLCWVLNSTESFSQKFKQAYEENKFKTVAEAVKSAAKIYSKHCSNYNRNKATVSSQDGVKTVLKKRKIIEINGIKSEQEEDTNQTKCLRIISNDDLSKQFFAKSRCIASLQENINKIKDVLNYSKQELKAKLDEDSDSIKFATQAFGNLESTTLRDRLAIPIAAIFYEIIDNFK